VETDEKGKGGVDRALGCAAIVGPVDMLGIVVVLNNMPIAVFAGTIGAA